MNTNHARQWQTEHTQRQQTQTKKVLVKKVVKRSWITKGEKVIYSFFAFILLLASLFIVSFSSKTDTLNREVITLEKSIESLQLDNETLHFEVSELSKPERITRIARENGLAIQDTKVKRAVTLNE